MEERMQRMNDHTRGAATNDAQGNVGQVLRRAEDLDRKSVV